MVLSFFQLLLKKYGKWFSKMRGNPVSELLITLLSNSLLYSVLFNNLN